MSVSALRAATSVSLPAKDSLSELQREARAEPGPNPGPSSPLRFDSIHFFLMYRSRLSFSLIYRYPFSFSYHRRPRLVPTESRVACRSTSPGSRETRFARRTTQLSRNQETIDILARVVSPNDIQFSYRHMSIQIFNLLYQNEEILTNCNSIYTVEISVKIIQVHTLKEIKLKPDSINSIS